MPKGSPWQSRSAELAFSCGATSVLRLANDESADQFVGGTVYQAFLSATNYHRWHAPVAGTRARVRAGWHVLLRGWFRRPGRRGAHQLTGLPRACG
ncbi:phosphatidylserine decarboxylase, partial [Oryzihumus sp.]